MRAVALEALLEGWPHQEGLASLLAEARQSLSPDLIDYPRPRIHNNVFNAGLWTARVIDYSEQPRVSGTPV